MLPALCSPQDNLMGLIICRLERPSPNSHTPLTLSPPSLYLCDLSSQAVAQVLTW